MVGSRSCWLDPGMSPPTIFCLASLVLVPTIAYCLLFNIGAIILRQDKYNSKTGEFLVLSPRGMFAEFLRLIIVLFYGMAAMLFLCNGILLIKKKSILLIQGNLPRILPMSTLR